MRVKGGGIILTEEDLIRLAKNILGFDYKITLTFDGFTRQETFKWVYSYHSDHAIAIK